MQLLIRNIRQLVTVRSGGKPFLAGREMRDPGVLEHVSVLTEGETIRGIGPADSFDNSLEEDATVLDASAYVALPGFVDSHTHMVFAGSREDEFAMRAEGS